MKAGTYETSWADGQNTPRKLFI